MATLDVLGIPPKKIETMKTKEELVHFFNQVYAMSISASFDVKNIKEFENNILNDIKKFHIGIPVEKPQIAWYVITLLYIRRLMEFIGENEYVIQIIDLTLSNFKKYGLEDIKRKTMSIYSIYMLKNDQPSFIPRFSLLEEPLVFISSYIYMAMFNKKKTIMNTLNRKLPIGKIDIPKLNSFYGSIELKSKKEIVEAIYDIIFNTVMNQNTKNSEDLYDFETCSNDELQQASREIVMSINMALNAFIHDVTTINDCSAKIAETIMNEVLNIAIN